MLKADVVIPQGGLIKNGYARESSKNILDPPGKLIEHYNSIWYGRKVNRIGAKLGPTVTQMPIVI